MHHGASPPSPPPRRPAWEHYFSDCEHIDKRARVAWHGFGNRRPQRKQRYVKGMARSGAQTCFTAHPLPWFDPSGSTRTCVCTRARVHCVRTSMCVRARVFRVCLRVRPCVCRHMCAREREPISLPCVHTHLCACTGTCVCGQLLVLAHVLGCIDARMRVRMYIRCECVACSTPNLCDVISATSTVLSVEPSSTTITSHVADPRSRVRFSLVCKFRIISSLPSM